MRLGETKFCFNLPKARYSSILGYPTSSKENTLRNSCSPEPTANSTTSKNSACFPRIDGIYRKDAIQPQGLNSRLHTRHAVLGKRPQMLRGKLPRKHVAPRRHLHFPRTCRPHRPRPLLGKHTNLLQRQNKKNHESHQPNRQP